jgi:hypothetical protein
VNPYLFTPHITPHYDLDSTGQHWISQKRIYA